MKKTFLTAAAIAFLGSPLSTKAQPGGYTCWFQMQAGAEQLKGFNCKVTNSLDTNGNTIHAVVEPNGISRRIALWDNQRAEIWLYGKRYLGNWKFDSFGNVRIDVDGGLGVLAFKPNNYAVIRSNSSGPGQAQLTLNDTPGSAPTQRQNATQNNATNRSNYLSLKAVASTWKNNQVAALQRFDGKQVVVKGYVDGIYQDRIEVQHF